MPSSESKRKRGHYNEYNGQTKAKMARYASENGATKEAKHFTKQLQCRAHSQQNNHTEHSRKVLSACTGRGRPDIDD